MPQTPTYGFEYETPQSKPGITLTGDIDGSSPILAEQVEIVIAGIDARVASAEEDISILQAGAAHDTGWLALSVTPGSGFSAALVAVYRRWGPMAAIRVEFQRTGAALTANAQGNIVGDPTLCTINTTEVRPDQQLVAVINASVTSGSGIMSTGGLITIADLNSNSSIATDDVVRVTSTYFVSTFV